MPPKLIHGQTFSFGKEGKNGLGGPGDHYWIVEVCRVLSIWTRLLCVYYEKSMLRSLGGWSIFKPRYDGDATTNFLKCLRMLSIHAHKFLYGSKNIHSFSKKIYSSFAYIQETVVAMLKEPRKPLMFKSIRTSNGYEWTSNNKTQWNWFILLFSALGRNSFANLGLGLQRYIASRSAITQYYISTWFTK